MDYTVKTKHETHGAITYKGMGILVGSLLTYRDGDLVIVTAVDTSCDYENPIRGAYLYSTDGSKSKNDHYCHLNYIKGFYSKREASATLRKYTHQDAQRHLANINYIEPLTMKSTSFYFEKIPTTNILTKFLDKLFGGTPTVVTRQVTTEDIPLDISKEGLQRIQGLIEGAANSEDLDRIEVVCIKLKELTVKLSSDLDARLKQLDLTFKHIERLHSEVLLELSKLEEGTDEHDLNNMMAKDLSANIEEMRDCRDKIIKTTSISKHMAKYLDTRLALLNASVNIIRINDLCSSFCGLVEMFKSLETKTTYMKETGTAEIGLLVDARN